MKTTCYLCAAILIISAIFGGIYAFSGINALKIVCFGDEYIYRAYLAVNATAALFTLYSLFAFRPYKGVSRK